MLVRIFYRNRSGKDTKVLGWTEDLAANPIIFRDLPLTDPANQYVAYADIEVSDRTYQAANERGAFLNKIDNGILVARAQADVDKDIANKTFYIEDAEAQIKPYLGGREKVTMLMFATDNLFIYLKALQAALPLSDNLMSAEGQTAKATLQSMQTNLSAPIKAIMDAMDAAIALLDQED